MSSSEKLSTTGIAVNSFFYYWRLHVLLALGIAAATAVLTGALIVGDSMRTSLRELALDRLGKIDELIVADGFFTRKLADQLSDSPTFKKGYDSAHAAIMFPSGTVEVGDEYGDSRLRRANAVFVFGVSDSFWELADGSLAVESTSGRQVIINQVLADRLQISQPKTDSVTLRIPKPGQLPCR